MVISSHSFVFNSSPHFFLPSQQSPEPISQGSSSFSGFLRQVTYSYLFSSTWIHFEPIFILFSMHTLVLNFIDELSPRPGTEFQAIAKYARLLFLNLTAKVILPLL